MAKKTKQQGMQDLHMDTIAVHQLKENWPWLLALGIGLVILGALALVFSWTSTLLSIIYLGAFLMVVGLFEGIKSFKINKWGSFLLHLVLAVLYVACGIFIAFNPTANALSLTLILAIFFVISGMLKIFFALTHSMANQGWVILNGILSIVLGILVWSQWPVSGLWVLGTFVGIDALFAGCSWIALARKARRLAIKS